MYYIFGYHFFDRFRFALLFVYLCSSLFFVGSSSSSLKWYNDTSYPFEVSDAVSLIGQDDSIYVFGGFNSSGSSVSDSYKFNITSETAREWYFVDPMANAVGAAAGCVANDGRFLVFGGKGSNDSFLGVIQIYNTTSHQWNTTYAHVTSNNSIADMLCSG